MEPIRANEMREKYKLAQVKREVEAAAKKLAHEQKTFESAMCERDRLLRNMEIYLEFPYEEHLQLGVEIAIQTVELLQELGYVGRLIYPRLQIDLPAEA